MMYSHNKHRILGSCRDQLSVKSLTMALGSRACQRLLPSIQISCAEQSITLWQAAFWITHILGTKQAFVKARYDVISFYLMLYKST